MSALTHFMPATPAMIAGFGENDRILPLGFDQPFMLLGGDCLGPDGIPFLVMHEHQPAFLKWVRERCEASLAAERPWFSGGILLIGGVPGAGRTHAARWLARVSGVPHVILNLTDPIIAANIAASRGLSEALWASPITVAMAAARCANPIVTVLGADLVTDDVLAGLAAMMDPQAGRRWREDCLGIDVDFGEVTWILQHNQFREVPFWIAPGAHMVDLDRPGDMPRSSLTLSICAEAMGDVGIQPFDWSWKDILSLLEGGHWSSANRIYERIVEGAREKSQIRVHDISAGEDS